MLVLKLLIRYHISNLHFKCFFLIFVSHFILFSMLREGCVPVHSEIKG